METYHGSDLVVDFLVHLGIEHVALNPGATLRGIHDSLLRRRSPGIVSTLHEEIAVALAHGYAKSAGRPMAVAIHDHVGPQHALMALFNAWADDTPLLVLGGSGPRDTARRRPWLDWIHTGSPQGAVVRDVVKWEAEPSSLDGLVPTLARAYAAALSAPPGPVYVAVDVLLQEQPADRASHPFPPVSVSPSPVAPAEEVSGLARRLRASDRPLFLVDRPPRGTMEPLVAIAEQLGAGVVDLGSRCSFPTTHWADQTDVRADVLAGTDLVVVLDPRDLLWAITRVDETSRELVSLVRPGTPIFCLGTTATRHHAALDRAAEVPGAHQLVGDVPATLLMLSEELARLGPLRRDRLQARRDTLTRRWMSAREASRAQAEGSSAAAPITPSHLAACLQRAVQAGPWQVANGLLGGWLRRLWDFRSESDYLGRSGGEGLGYGLPASVGAALAQRDSDVLVVDVQADGDMLYTPQALWTAAHHRLPLLVVVYDNRAYGRDLVHQRLIAEARGREVDPTPEGVTLRNPDVGFTKLAEAQGVEAMGPIVDPSHLEGTLRQAAARVRDERRPLLVHVVCG